VYASFSDRLISVKRQVLDVVDCRREEEKLRATRRLRIFM